MWQWRDEYFESLRTVASQASEHSEWAGYFSYCSQLEQGLRKPALSTLKSFISSLSSQPFVARKAFVGWLLPIAATSRASHMLVPHPLWQDLVRPTVVEWLAVEPNSLEAHRWARIYARA
ncbi:hypothetical protein GCM10011521_14810 [Arenimonas soli]|uniref:Uncharacterized protein n=1 Tax=Arenimonas soli TaxID=2269504 RepID=A0ABQ1HH63_9GAMM|nr:hypothetical protein GCM10011521_14810 [Arenimonas soli]